MHPRIPPPLLMLLSAALMWILHRWLPLAHWIAPPWNRLAVLPVAVGIVLSVTAVARFRATRTTVSPMDPGKATYLVTDGAFRISRNPMYLSLLLLLMGWAVWLGTASPWVVLPLFIIIITVMQIVPEEQALERLFGEQYVAYKRNVLRWLGRRH